MGMEGEGERRTKGESQHEREVGGRTRERGEGRGESRHEREVRESGAWGWRLRERS